MFTELQRNELRILFDCIRRFNAC